jgi:hypothetical protein
MARRREEDVAAAHVISAPTFALFDKLRAEAQVDLEIAAIHTQLEGALLPMAGSRPTVLCCSEARFHSRSI